MNSYNEFITKSNQHSSTKSIPLKIAFSCYFCQSNFRKLVDSAISAAQVLASKHIPFCLYRLPGTEDIRIATDAEVVGPGVNRGFVIRPFSKTSIAEPLLYATINSEDLGSDFIQYLKTCRSRAPISCLRFPSETSKTEYFHGIQAYLDEIRQGKLIKAVYSRVIYVEKPINFEPVECFLRLCNSYPNAFVHFLSDPRTGTWLGASPELLLRRRGRTLSTAALAGSQALHASGEYHWREKEMEEHLLVGRHIEQVFSDCHYPLLEKKGPYTVEAGTVAHLKTEYTFEDNQEQDLESLIEKLHPTPAVGGTPVPEGLACISRHEHYDRQYYCGIIGEMNNKDDVSLYVNLRCMQVGDSRIAIYAGGGITADSDPEEEWQETILKSRTMVDNINPRQN